MLQSGMRVKCPSGMRRVETLLPSDLVTTADQGELELLSCESLVRPTRDLPTDLHPIRLDRWCFGAGFPRRDLTVSPAQRVAVKGARMGAMLGTEDGLVCASELLEHDGIRRLDRDEIAYTRLVLRTSALLIVHGWALEVPGIEQSSEAEVREAQKFFSTLEAEC
ncbi:MAG: Hint domain-containing protein [Pseudomonadota bacterium]